MGFVPGMISQNAFAKSKQSLSKESMQSFTEKRFKENDYHNNNTNNIKAILSKTNLYNRK
jgi:hypothetical protein